MDDLLLYVPRRYDVYERTRLGGNNLGIWFAHDAITKLDVAIKLGAWQRNIDQIILLNEKCQAFTVTYIDSFHVKNFEALVTEKFDGTLDGLLAKTHDLNTVGRITTLMIEAYIKLAQCGYVEQHPSLDNIVYNLYENGSIDIRFIDYEDSGDYSNVREILRDFADKISRSEALSKAKIDIITRLIYEMAQ